MAVVNKNKGFFSRFLGINQESEELLEQTVETKAPSVMDEKRQALERKAENFLESGMLSIFYEMVKNGYKMPVAQSKKFHGFIADMIEDNKLAQLADLITHGYELHPQEYTRLMLSANYQNNLYYTLGRADDSIREHYKKEANDAIVPVILHLKNLTTNPEYTAQLFTDWSGKMLNTVELYATTFDTNKFEPVIKSVGVLREIYDLIRKQMFSNSNLDDYMEVLRKTKESIPYIEICQKRFRQMEIYEDNAGAKLKDFLKVVDEHMVVQLKKYFSDDLNNLFQETQALYLHEHLSQLTKDVSSSIIKKINIAKLPSLSQDIINSIKNDYSKIAPVLNTLGQEQQHNVTQLVNEQLPHILQKYFSMDEEYRNTMKDHSGKTAFDLLNDSLTNIQSHLHNIKEGLNENTLKDLKVASNYTQAKNNRM